MFVKEPTHIHEDSRYLNHKEHDAKHNDKVHKVERLIEGQGGDDVVCDSLVVKSSVTPYYYCYEEEVNYEESTCCYQCPNMNVSNRLDALSTVKDGLTVRADVE